MDFNEKKDLDFNEENLNDKQEENAEKTENIPKTINDYAFYTENVKQKKSRMGLGILIGVFAGIFLTVAVGAGTMVSRNIIKGFGEFGKNGILTEGLDNANSFDFNRFNEGEREVKSIVEISAQVSPGVVMVTTSAIVNSMFGATTARGSGSGIIANEEGYIITNNHVIENAHNINVILSDGSEYPAKIIGSDVKTDIAVLKIDGAMNLTAVNMGDSDKLQVGEIAIAIGNPLGTQLTGTVTQGVISATNRTVQTSENTYVNLIQTDAAINSGNSGGALVNGYGEVIGINTVKYAASGVEGIGFAIPINDVIPIVRDLVDKGYVSGRPFIGITPIEVTKQLAAVNNIPEGLYVANVVPGSAAELGGIKTGDVITGADGKEVKTASELNEIRDSKKIGEELKLDVYRDGKNITVTIYLKEDKSGAN